MAALVQLHDPEKPAKDNRRKTSPAGIPVSPRGLLAKIWVSFWLLVQPLMFPLLSHTISSSTARVIQVGKFLSIIVTGYNLMTGFLRRRILFFAENLLQC